jgi:hypothetical protein
VAFDCGPSEPTMPCFSSSRLTPCNGCNRTSGISQLLACGDLLSGYLAINHSQHAGSDVKRVAVLAFFSATIGSDSSNSGKEILLAPLILTCALSQSIYMGVRSTNVEGGVCQSSVTLAKMRSCGHTANNQMSERTILAGDGVMQTEEILARPSSLCITAHQIGGRQGLLQQAGIFE